MHVHVTLLHSLPTTVGAVRFKIIDKLLKAHVSFESVWQRFLAGRTLSLWKMLEASFANDIATLHAIEWHFWQLKAYDALKLLKSQRLLQWIRHWHSLCHLLSRPLINLVSILWLHFQFTFEIVGQVAANV